MPMISESVTDVTDHTYKSVTRAHVRAYGADRELSVTSVTPVTSFPDLHGDNEAPRCMPALDLGPTTGRVIDLKLARLQHDPEDRKSIAGLIAYAALLSEVSE